MTFVNGKLVWQKENKNMERLLILEDGTVFEGKAFGADANVFGEIVLQQV